MLNFPEAIETNKKNNFQNLKKSDLTFLSQLGSGSFGKVYKVSLKKTNTQYALKVLSKKQLETLKLQAQFENEIKILSKCNHKKIIKLYSLFEDKEYIYMLMELAKGGTLYHKLKKSKKFSEELTKKYMTDVISAISYLHSQKPVILHRDLKPENILMSEEGLKIADFGWSNLDDNSRNTFCGTPEYLSPEMILGTGHCEKLDIWTLGVLMFELLSGRAPFTPGYRIKDVRLRQKKIEDNVLEGKIDFKGVNVSEEAREVILKMLSPKEDDRPSANNILKMRFFNTGNEINLDQKKNMDKNYLNKENEIILNLKKELDRKNLECIKKDQEISILAKKINSLKSSNRNLSKSVEKSKIQKNDFVTKKDFENLKNELNKQEKTVAYLFKKTKHLSSLISDFYAKNISSKNLNITQDYILSYESTLTKIKFIFEEFTKLKNFKENKNSSNNNKNIFKDFDEEEAQKKISDLLSGNFDESVDYENGVRGKPHVPKTTFDRNLKKF